MWCKNKKLMLKENDVDAYTVSEPAEYRSGKKPL